MAATLVRIGNFMGTGIDLLPMPTSPGYRTQGWTPTDAVASNVSPFTRKTQVQEWAGGEYWAVTVTLPRLSRADAANWTAKLQGTRGITHAFQLGDQSQQGPLNPDGAAGSTPVVDATTAITNMAGTPTLATRGWVAGSYRVLSTGDYLQVGYRLYRVMGDVNADGTGRALIVTWPSLREQPADATPIDIAQPVGIFRRANNKLTWTSSYDGLSELSFDAVEVI